jgi:hypothetical protein
MAVPTLATPLGPKATLGSNLRIGYGLVITQKG